MSNSFPLGKLDFTPPPSWTQLTVGHVCDEQGGEVQTGPFGSQLHASDYCGEEGVPVVMPTNMYDGKIVTSKVARVDSSHVERLSKHMLRTGDIVFSRRGDVARFAVVNCVEEGWLCGTGSMRIRLNDPEIDTRFLRRFLQLESVGRWLNHNAKGITMPNLNTNILRALPLYFPPLPEQRRIAAILDKADAIRQKREEGIRLTEELLRSTFLEMFGDPVTNPKGWQTDNLSVVCTTLSDGPFGSNLKSEHYTEQGVRVARLQNIGAGEWVDDNKVFIARDHFESLPRHHCRPGDILIGTLGEPNLRACILPDHVREALNKADCILARPDEKRMLPKFLCAYLNTSGALALVAQMLHGQTRVRVSMGQLKDLAVFLPPVPLQKSFCSIYSDVVEMKSRRKRTAEAAGELFASLTQRAFRGEL